MSDTVPSLRIVKTMPFKGGSRDYSNRYHFLGGVPSDTAAWEALMDDVVTAEKACTTTGQSITQAIGYEAGSDVPVASKAYTTAGTFAPTVGYAPGEVVALVRYSTAERTTKNHPIYLFNYYHHVSVDNMTTSCDFLEGDQKTAFQTYADAWLSGFTDGVNTYTRCGPRGQAATGMLVEGYVTHRDFPYSTSK